MSDKIRIGGLMRCCIETIRELYAADPGHQANDGDMLECQWHETRMRFRDGAWEWDKHPDGR